VPQLRFERVHRASGSAADPVSRLRRFPDNRFIGRRDKMTVYDCDEHRQYAVLAEGVDRERLDHRNLLQAFAPDTEAEAHNRGFKSVVNPTR
jgi:hypothetical protein